VSSDSGPAVEMVKKWTRENYVFPQDRDMLLWVEEKIEGVPSRYHDDDQVSSLCLFDVIGLRFPLSPFEWVGSESSVPLFFSFFGVLRTFSDSSKNQGFVSFQQKPKIWTQFIDFYKWERDEYFLVGSCHEEAHNMLCYVNQSRPSDSGSLSDTDDEVDDDIRSHFNELPPKRVPQRGGETDEGVCHLVSGC
ncbi:hypothetical protein A2U01_0023674, partial [Trifolium medium]|nr:hypothetical protein [Trifolium medium]